MIGTRTQKRCISWGVAVLAALSTAAHAQRGPGGIVTAPDGTPSGKTWTNPKDGSVMILCPAGRFKMGSSDGRPDQKPVEDVSVASFYIGKYEVTNRQFKKFVDANPQWRKGRVDSRLAHRRYLRYWKGDTYPSDNAGYPVIYVSWFAAKAYCEWAGGRLPTEAEWEYACRAGSTTDYCFGNRTQKGGFWGIAAWDVLGEYAWYKANSYGSTHPVGQKKPNRWGIHDMHGNVYEWCSDLERAYPYKTDDRREDMNDAPLMGVLRGGSWADDGTDCRSVLRGNLGPTECLYVIGFRVALSAKAPK